MLSEAEIKKEVFIALKKGIDNILSENESLINDNKIDIEALAAKSGIKDIQEVTPNEMKRIREEFFNSHACLMGKTIFLNNEDNPEKKRFSVAHEIFHHICRGDNEMLAVARHGEVWKKENEGSDGAYVETIADYFAANLLIPTELFILFDEKTDKEIALIFNVEEKCIKKRRTEIEQEIVLLEPEDLASDVIVEDKTPLTLDEIHEALKGNGVEGQV